MATDRPTVPFIRYQPDGLLPCPFCGGPAELTVCGPDHLAACAAANNTCPAYAVAGPYATAAGAAAAWNQRSQGEAMPYRARTINTTQLAALRRAAESDTLKILSVDRTTCKALRDRGFAVELDDNGRHVFDAPFLKPVGVIESVTSADVQVGPPYNHTTFFVTAAGCERAAYAADVAAMPADGRPVDPTLMEDL